RPAARPGIQHELVAVGRARRAWPASRSANPWSPVGQGISDQQSRETHELFRVPPMNHRKHLGPELEAIQDRLKDAHGKRYWRTLEELADSEAFRELMRLEFPAQADVWPDSMSRRRFLGLMG